MSADEAVIDLETGAGIVTAEGEGEQQTPKAEQESCPIKDEPQKEVEPEQQKR